MPPHAEPSHSVTSSAVISAEQLADSFALNLRIIGMQTAGLSHADSLIQTDYRINCLNWVLGHIAVGRDGILKLLGEAPILSNERTARYQSDSEPITGDEEGVITLEDLLEILALGQQLISSILPRLIEEQLTTDLTVNSGSRSLGRHLFGLYFHDTYHTGQIELLRQVTGANDKII